MKTTFYAKYFKLVLPVILSIHSHTAYSFCKLNGDTTDIKIVKKEVPTNFIPSLINKEFLEAIYLKANQINSETKLDILYSIQGKIDKNYLKDKKQIAIKTVSNDVYKGKLICVSKHGVYIYNEYDLGFVYCDFKSIDWIRRGRSYGNWLWKTAIGLGTIFAYQFNEQSIEAYTQAYLSGAAATITLGQIVVAPFYSLRLKYPSIKFNIQGKLENGIKYYGMIINDPKNYSNSVDFKSYPGYMPSEN